MNNLLRASPDTGITAWTTLRTMLRAGFLAALAATAAMPMARADDIDIYTTSVPPPPAQAPITFLALDLPLNPTLTVLCDNLLTNPSPECTLARAGTTVENLAALTGVPLPPLVVGLAGSATAILGSLPAATRGLIDSALTAAGTPLPPVTDTAAMGLVVQDILENLINSRVAIFLNHGNRGPAGTAGANLPCAFADQSSLGGQRNSTPACSNGAYLFVGLRNLADPLQTLELTNRILTALVPRLQTNPPGFRLPYSLGPSIDQPYQTKEIYAELVRVLKGDRVFNGHLGYFDYGDTDAVTNLDTSLPVLSWDPAAERNSNLNYNSVIDAFPNACNISLLHLQLTNSRLQDESDTELASVFPGADANGDGLLSTAEVVDYASKTGFMYNNSARRIKSLFVVQDNLADATALAGVGGNVVSYTNVLGLLGRGGDIAGALNQPTRSDASFTGPSLLFSRNANNGLDNAAYVPILRAATSNRPDWPGNIKRLNFNAPINGTPTFTDFNNVLAFGADGRIIPSALTVWTNSAQLGSGVNRDGHVADLGGAGQQIPGYQVGGGGNPDRRNPQNANQTRRNLFYDSYSAAPVLKALEPDDSAVRTELSTSLAAAAATTTLSPCSDSSAQTSCQNTCTAQPGCLVVLGINSCALTCTASCTASCEVTRTADTVAGELLLHARGFDVGTTSTPKPTNASNKSNPTQIGTANSTAVTGRPWMLGSVIHGRPVALNYDSRTGQPSRVRVLFGSNDGYLRMLDGATGKELWGFMPQVLMGNLKLLRDNTAGSGFAYGVDAPPVLMVVDRSGTSTSPTSADGWLNSASSANDKVMAFVGLRRGGKHIYALDITDPDNPTLAWRIGPDGLRRAGTSGVISGTATQFSSLALTFSNPKVSRVQVSIGGTTQSRRVLIFGGGYNGKSSGAATGKDIRTDNIVTLTTDERIGTDEVGKGTAIYMVDADTGELIWKAENVASGASYTAATLTYGHAKLVDSIASDVTLLDTNSDGVMDRLYVGDTGGRLWRGDFGGVDRANWTFIPVTSIGRHAYSAPSFADDRRIFQAPDVVRVRGEGSNNRKAYDLVLFGTGDRENPHDTTTLNRFYVFRDKVLGIGQTAQAVTDSLVMTGGYDRFDSFKDVTTTCNTEAATGCDVTAEADTVAGYSINFRTGEKLVTTPLTQGGGTVFSTYIPEFFDCFSSEVGAARLYSIGARSTKPVRFFNNTTRDVAQAASGFPGEILPLGPSSVLTGNQPAKLNDQPPFFPAGWTERLSEDERAVTQP